jgi:hypothetical protein
MPRTATSCPSTDTAAARLAALEAELANLPADIEAAEIAGDETRLSSLIARERILGRQVVTARQAAAQERASIVQAQFDRLSAERMRVADEVAVLELARDVYAASANHIRATKLGPTTQQWDRVQRQLIEIDADLGGWQ